MENIWMFLQQTAAASLVALFLLILQRIFLDKLSPGGSTGCGLSCSCGCWCRRALGAAPPSWT